MKMFFYVTFSEKIYFRFREQLWVFGDQTGNVPLSEENKIGENVFFSTPVLREEAPTFRSWESGISSIFIWIFSLGPPQWLKWWFFKVAVERGGGRGQGRGSFWDIFSTRAVVLLTFFSLPPLTLLASRVPYHSHNSRIQYNGHCVVYSRGLF